MGKLTPPEIKLTHAEVVALIKYTKFVDGCYRDELLPKKSVQPIARILAVLPSPCSDNCLTLLKQQSSHWEYLSELFQGIQQTPLQLTEQELVDIFASAHLHEEPSHVVSRLQQARVPKQSDDDMDVCVEEIKENSGASRNQAVVTSPATELLAQFPGGRLFPSATSSSSSSSVAPLSPRKRKTEIPHKDTDKKPKNETEKPSENTSNEQTPNTWGWWKSE